MDITTETQDVAREWLEDYRIVQNYERLILWQALETRDIAICQRYSP